MVTKVTKINTAEGGKALSEGARSLTEGVFERLRDDVLKCRLPPDSRLRIAELCARFDVSIHAVREALSRLASEELVIVEPQRGFRVAPVSVEDLEDLTQTRIEIETLAVRKSIAKGSVAWESSVVAALHQVLRVPKFEDSETFAVSEAWSHAHANFHAALVSACESRRLLWLRGALFDHSERYRRLAGDFDRGHRDTDGEHLAIGNAVLERRTEDASELLAAHLLTTMQLVKARWKI